MMSKRAFGPLILLAAWFWMPAAEASDIKTTWHREADPARYSTFAFAPRGEAPAARKLLDPPTEATVRKEIIDRLRRMGYRLAGEGEAPDFRIQYDASAEQTYIREVPQREHLPFNEDDWIVPQFEVLSESYLNGTLILTIRDGASGEPVWCGWTTESLERKKLDRRVKKIIRRILLEYPLLGKDRQSP